MNNFQESALYIKTSDDHIFKVDLEIAVQSQTIRTMLDDLGIDEDTITLTNKEITGPVFKKAMEWCRQIKNDKPDNGLTKKNEFESNADLLKDWEKDYINRSVSMVRELHTLMITADILEIKGLKILMTKALGLCTGAVLKPTNPFFKANQVSDQVFGDKYFPQGNGSQKRRLFTKEERNGGRTTKIRSLKAGSFQKIRKMFQGRKVGL